MNPSRDTLLLSELKEAELASDEQKRVLRNKPSVRLDPDGIKRGKPGSFTIFQLLMKMERDIRKGQPNECWEWKGIRNHANYGTVTHRSLHFGAHRVAFIIATGIDPTGKMVCHKCDNPPCCNPSHLFLGTCRDNVQDMIQKGRRRIYEGIGHHSAKLSPEIAREIRHKSKNGTATRRGMAQFYGVNRATIDKILSGKTWADSE